MVGLVTGATPYIAIGTGTTAPAATDTAMQTETVRVLASVVSVSNNVLTLKGFITTAQANVAIAETGIMRAAAAGTMISHEAVSPVQTKTSSLEGVVEYSITLERA